MSSACRSAVMSAPAGPASVIVDTVRSRFGTVSFNRIEGLGLSEVVVGIYQLGALRGIDLNQQDKDAAVYSTRTIPVISLWGPQR